MDDNFKKYKLVFDIGANNGSSAHYLLTQSEKVICFEPNILLAEQLKLDFKDKNVIISTKGLSNKVETKTFYISNMGGVLSTFAREWMEQSRFTGKGKWDTNLTVETTTLDIAIEQYGIPNFIKIDVEGYEYEVFQGLTTLLENTLFGFEWAEEMFGNVQKIVEYVKQLGYNSFAFTYGDNLKEIEKLQFKDWSELNIHNDIKPQRKTAWGMIYFKK